MMLRHFMASSVALALLLGTQLAAAQDRSEAPPPSDESTVQRTTRSGGFLPLTLFPNVGDDARAIGAGYGGYDGARDSARLQSFAEARLFGPLALRVTVQSRDVGETVSPGAMARLQLLNHAKHGVDGAVALAYKAEGFNEPEGELELVLAVAGNLGNWRLLGNLAYGQDPEAFERDGEVRAAVLRTLGARYTLGLDARGRFDLGSERSKLLKRDEPRFDLDVGPALMVALGPLQLGLHSGLVAFNRVEGPTQTGLFATAGIGTAL